MYIYKYYLSTHFGSKLLAEKVLMSAEMCVCLEEITNLLPCCFCLSSAKEEHLGTYVH